MRARASLVFTVAMALCAHADERMPAAANDATVPAAIATAERTHGPRSREVADALAQAVDAAREDFRIETHADDFIALARREVELRRDINGESSLAYARALRRLGYALVAAYANEDAQRQFERVQAIIDALGATADADARADAAIDLGYVLRVQRKDLARAVESIESGLSLSAKLPARRRIWKPITVATVGARIVMPKPSTLRSGRLASASPTPTSRTMRPVRKSWTARVRQFTARSTVAKNVVCEARSGKAFAVTPTCWK